MATLVGISLGGCKNIPPAVLTIQATDGPQIQPTITSTPRLGPTSSVRGEEPTPTHRIATQVNGEEIPKTGEIRERQSDGMIMVYVPGGSFEMGGTEADVEATLSLCNQYPGAHCYESFFRQQLPQHLVSLDGFWIDQTEVSSSQYRLCVEAGVCQAPTSCEKGEFTFGDPTRSDDPVICVNWFDSESYCEWAGGRLPTEAEWEYAARGPEGSFYPWGNDFTAGRMNYCDVNCENTWADNVVDDGYAYTAPVGSYPQGASWCGALDMAGNVFEWVGDWYSEYPPDEASIPTGPADGNEKVLRGGSWYYDPARARSANRDSVDPVTRFGFLGFRCAVPVGVENITLPTAIPVSRLTPASVDQVLDDLKGLALDEFFEESYKALILRSPQKVSELGLADKYGMRNDQLDDLSDAAQRETWKLEAGILELLQAYDRESLTPEQRNNYDVYEWYLDQRVQGQRFAYHSYPLNHFLDSYQFLIEQLFTEYHPLEDKEDYEDYITRLSQVDRQVEGLFEGLKIRQQMGIIPPRFIIELTRQDIFERLGTRSVDARTVNPLGLKVYLVFQDKVLKNPGFNDQEKAALLEAAREQVEASFIPAHIKLLNYLNEIEPQAPEEAGVWIWPDGEAYYTWKLRWETSTDLTPEQVHAIGLAEVERIQEEMRAALKELRYPAQLLSQNEMIEMARNEAGYFNTDSSSGKDQVIEAYEALLEEVERRIQPVFELYPSMELIVYGDESFGGGGGFYVPGALDGSRPGAFHTGVGGGYVPKMGMPTILFHEAVPGHHFQIALAFDLGLPTFRTDILLNGYAEGWALYAEQLAWELGMYEQNPHGNVGRLQFELLRAARLVADTGIHTKKWTRSEAQSYMDRIMGGFTYEVDRYVVDPVQATGYKIGMLKILELRQLAQDELGEDFDLKEFHTVVLGNGSLPLEMLERIVQEYIEAKKAH